SPQPIITIRRTDDRETDDCNLRSKPDRAGALLRAEGRYPDRDANSVDYRRKIELRIARRIGIPLVGAPMYVDRIDSERLHLGRSAGYVASGVKIADDGDSGLLARIYRRPDGCIRSDCTDGR